MSSARAKHPILVAVDTGGTFTDFFVLSPEGPRTYKVPSTPRDPSRAILRGISEMKLRGDLVLVHGTTVATNALLEKKGARVALVTTRGFEDLLVIGRQNRLKLYDLNPKRPPVLVESNLRLGVKERIDAQGRVLHALDLREVKALKARLKQLKAESVAVCLLSSYKNPRHEKRLGGSLKKIQKPLSLSSEICPEYREYERLSTTCVNAYVTPVMKGYLSRLKKSLPQKIRIMQSNGGSLSLEEAGGEAVRTLLSGPAGGALGALRAASKAGETKLLSLDIGGTSTDLSLIDGDLELTSEASLAGYPVKIPMIRIHTLGAGGGSIARLDAGGALKVGPESAGADPGPLCYGRGGKEITLTDAHLALNRIDPGQFLGGRMTLQTRPVLKALSRLAARMKKSREETAEGIVRIANSNIERGLRVISLERGYDPRNFSLIAFGGAGPLHACELADLLNIPRVLIPPYPGLLSAYGMAHADWVRDKVRTVLLPEVKNFESALEAHYLDLEKKARLEARREGFSPSALQFFRKVDLRYRGQSYEITLDFSQRLKERFEAAHQKRFGYRHRKQPIEAVNVRLQVRARTIKTKFAGNASFFPLAPSPKKMEIFWGGKFRKALLYLRQDLGPSTVLKGPAVVAEYSATTLVPPGWSCRVDENENLRMEKKI